MCSWFLNFQAFLWKRKIIVKSLLASLPKTVTNPDYCSESRIKISVPAFHCFRWSVFSSIHVIVGFRNNFLNHRRLSEQPLESQAATWKPEARRNFIFKSSRQKGSQILWKPSAIMQKVLIWFFGPLKKIFISWHNLFKVLFPASFSSYVQYVPHQSVMLSHWLDISCPLCVVSHHWLFAHDTRVISRIFMFIIVQISNISTEYIFVVFSHWLFNITCIVMSSYLLFEHDTSVISQIFMFIFFTFSTFSIHFFVMLSYGLFTLCNVLSLVCELNFIQGTQYPPWR